ncbi:MAG: glycosyltransferase, partial [Myxococcales bacterium]|nr:glycosyltransferase [Polyangiaceae bacterium]MDW8251707.1 glycosyltransferase [Myxococcales bacterium]
MTHILAVALNAPPKNSPESIQVGRYLSALARAGLEITLVTSREVASWAPEEPALERYLAEIEVIRFPFPEKRWFVGAARRVAPPLLDLPDDNALFLLRFPFLLRKIRRPPDVVYSRGLPLTSNLLGWALATHFRVPWVMHLSDPWVDNPFHHHPLAFLHRRLEASCFDQATYVTMTCEEARLHFARKYPHHAHKLLVSPNVYDEAPDPGLPPRSYPIRIVHTGRFYGSRRPDTFLEVLDRIAGEWDEVGLRVEFAGHAPPEVTARLARSAPLVRDHGPVSHEDACSLQRSAHVLLTIDAPSKDPRMALFFP